MAQKKKITVSFSGCGFLGIYHVGVVSCFREYEEQFDIERMAGASAGAIAAACYLCKCCLGKATSDVLKIASSARASPVGPLSPRFNIVKILHNGLNKILPEDAHLICSNRLSVSLTRCRDGQNLMVSNFDSKEELIQVLMCSAFVPLYSGLIPPYYKDGRYWDGGISNNLPTFDASTVTVSPFSGESDICPSDSSALSFLEMNFANQSFRINSTNAYRMSRALFPPHPDILKEICEEGYVDALRYIKKTLLYISGPSQPMATEVSTSRSSTDMEIGDETIEVVEAYEISTAQILSSTSTNSMCQLLEQYSSSTSNLPSTVIDALREAAEGEFQHPVIRALSIAALPWVLPLEFFYSTCVRLIELTPKPSTIELQYYIEIFSSIAQRVAGRILNRHGGNAWVKCNCTIESLPLGISGSRCVLHGKAIISQSHSLAFAFAIVEESPASDFLVGANSPQIADNDHTTLIQGDTARSTPFIVETTVLAAAICRNDGLDNLLDFEESCDIIERFENDIAEYFREQVLRQSLVTKPHYLDIEE